MSDMLKKTVQGSDLPDAIKSQILKLDEDFKAAMEKRDIPEVLKVLSKMQEIKKQMRDSGFGDDLGDDDNFDLNNFK
jgi:hypothetical protein